MIDREFDVRAYEEGYRAGKHDAQVEIERLRAENAKLRAALEEVMPFVEFQLHKMMEERNTIPITRALGLARAALGGDK